MAKLGEYGVKLILLRNAGFNNVDLEATDRVIERAIENNCRLRLAAVRMQYEPRRIPPSSMRCMSNVARIY